MTDYGALNRAYLDKLMDDPEYVARVARFMAALDAMPEPEPAAPCDGKHRGPEGPNEDLGQCHYCWSISFTMRPEGETYGWHADDCSLPLRHESYCQGGGTGHKVPPGETIRGYFGPDWSPDLLEHEPHHLRQGDTE